MGVTVEGGGVCGEMKGVCGRAVKLGMQKSLHNRRKYYVNIMVTFLKWSHKGHKYRLGFRTNLF